MTEEKSASASDVGKASIEEDPMSEVATEKELYVPRLLRKYREEVVPQLRERFGYTNELEVPRLWKIVISMGVGKAVENRARLDAAVRDLALLSGQKPIITRARRSVAGFRVRAGMPIGCMVTLRRARMYEFLDRLISIVIPRIRDFRGLNPHAFDGRGNYNMGLSDQLVFPEVPVDHVEFLQGMNISLVTTARTDEEGYELLRLLGMPFRERTR